MIYAYFQIKIKINLPRVLKDHAYCNYMLSFLMSFLLFTFFFVEIIYITFKKKLKLEKKVNTNI